MLLCPALLYPASLYPALLSPALLYPARAALAHLPGLNSLPSALAAEKKRQSLEALVANGPTPLTSQQRAIRNTPRKHYTGTGSGPNKFVNTKELPNTRIPVMRPPGKRAKKRAHVKYKWCVM